MYHKMKPNVGKYTVRPMDPLGIARAFGTRRTSINHAEFLKFFTPLEGEDFCLINPYRTPEVKGGLIVDPPDAYFR